MHREQWVKSGVCGSWVGGQGLLGPTSAGEQETSWGGPEMARVAVVSS